MLFYFKRKKWLWLRETWDARRET